jgi:hypothetical protein
MKDQTATAYLQRRVRYVPASAAGAPPTFGREDIDETVVPAVVAEL